MKGQIPIIEMIITVILIYITFSIFFPEGGFENRWDDASLVLKGRDTTVTIDRLGYINEFVWNSTTLASFLNSTIPERNLISWTSVEGTVQPNIVVACNCTTSQIQTLLNSMGRLKLNNREITVDFIASTLSPIQESDALLIWGYRDLTNYQAGIVEYLRDGNGVIILSNQGSPNPAFNAIFGLTDCASAGMGSGCGSSSGSGQLEILTTTDTSSPSYLPGKLFHRLPIRSVSTAMYNQNITVDPGLPACGTWPVPEGTLLFKTSVVRHWGCFANNTVYIEADGDNSADYALKENATFTAYGQSVRLSYSEMNSTYSRLFFSIKPTFQFDDFTGNSPRLFPSDLNANRILVRDGVYSGGNGIPVLAVNKSTPSHAIWIDEDVANPANFNHDERLLVASAVLAASSKQSKDPFFGEFEIGIQTPYINVVNRDMFEVYRFNLGLGFPF